jgi:hypothetical protein
MPSCGTFVVIHGIGGSSDRTKATCDALPRALVGAFAGATIPPCGTFVVIAVHDIGGCSSNTEATRDTLVRALVGAFTETTMPS